MATNTNPYKSISSGAIHESLFEVASATDSQLETYVEELTEEEATEFESWTQGKLQFVHLQSILWIGGILVMGRAAADKRGRSELFKKTVEELGISDTKAYASIAIFRHFGRVLLGEQELIGLFPVESLKMLTTKHATRAAREAAIECARAGERVSMKKADELLYEHAETYEQEEAENAVEAPAGKKSRHRITVKDKKSPGKKVWAYSGEVVRLVVQADSPKVNEDPASVMRDLEAALEEYRCDYVYGDRGVPTAATVQEVSHV